MQASLDAETRAKTEALRIKKKLESDINELEIALDHANKANAEAHKSIKRYQGQLRDTETAYEEEARQRQEIAERAGLAERKANALQGELEESRALLDSADRAKKQCDMELADSRAAVNDMTTVNSKASSDKRRVESAIHTMHAEIDDMLQQAKNSEEKAKKAMIDAARLADELRAEQDHFLYPRKVPSGPLRDRFQSWSSDWWRPMRMQPAEDAMPWQSWNHVFGSWKIELGNCQGTTSEDLQSLPEGREEGKGTSIPSRGGP